MQPSHAACAYLTYWLTLNGYYHRMQLPVCACCHLSDHFAYSNMFQRKYVSHLELLVRKVEKYIGGHCIFTMHIL